MFNFIDFPDIISNFVGDSKINTDNMTLKRMRGMGVAIITPFTETNEVDYEALERLVDLHLQSGTDFLCVQGTTGETPTLTL